jgi:hypothetical protein
VANSKPIKGLVEASRFRTINIDLVIDRDEFDVSALEEVIPIPEGYELATQTLTGPLRIGARGNDEFRLIGTSSFHDTRKPHYHITVNGTAIRKPTTPKKSAPRVADFFRAIANGIKPTATPSVVVLTQHRFPHDWWRGTALPVPLPPVGGEDHGAQLSGVEITFGSDTGTERLLVSAFGEQFSVVTMFRYKNVSANLFSDAVHRSAELTARMFQEPSDPNE